MHDAKRQCPKSPILDIPHLRWALDLKRPSRFKYLKGHFKRALAFLLTNCFTTYLPH